MLKLRLGNHDQNSQSTTSELLGDYPIVFGHGRIGGTVELSDSLAEGDGRSFVEVVLHGNLEVSMALVPNPGMYRPVATTTRTYQLLNMTNTLSIEDHDAKKPASERTMPFFFDIPSYCCEPASDQSRCCFERHAQHLLPPSMELPQPRSNAWTSDTIDGGSTLRLSECRIKYHVAARLWKGGKIMAHASREWKYIPTTEAPPPITVADFPGEYQLCAKTVAADVRRLKIYGTLKIQIEQPRPVVITPADMKTGARVVIPTMLCLRTPEKPDIIECRCELSLESYTFCSTKCQGATLPRLHRLPLLAMAERSTRILQECNVPTVAWRRIIDKQGPYWVADIDITVDLQKEDLPVPTFSVGFVSARNTLVMSVKLVNKKGHGAAPSVHLRTPLQVAYGPDGHGLEDSLGRVSHRRNVTVHASTESACDYKPPLYTSNNYAY